MRYFDQRVLLPQKQVLIFSHVYISKDYHSTEEPKHKLTQLATGPNLVTEVNYKTCVILRENNLKVLITLYRVLLVPDTVTTDSKVTKQSPKYL